MRGDLERVARAVPLVLVAVLPRLVVVLAQFSARNYFDLFAVFQGAREMAVRTENGDDVGTLQTSFVLTQGDQDFVFILSGRKWQVVDINVEAGVIWARPAPEGKLPRWQSPISGHVGRRLIEEHRQVLASHEVYEFLTDPAKTELRNARDTWADIVGVEGWPIVSSPKGVTVFTFAGGRVNLTLAKAVAARTGCTAASSNYEFVVQGGDGTVPGRVGDELRRLATEGFPMDLRRAIVGTVPRRPLSKFQTLLPVALEEEFLSARLFGFEDAQAVLGGQRFVLS